MTETSGTQPEALISYAAVSDTGHVRAANEDSAYAGPWLQAVADGMGGHAGGEVASALCIGSLRAADAAVAAGELTGVLSRAVRAANAAIRRRAEHDPGLQTMGTTLTATLWSGWRFAVAHIGDSRAYRLRNGRLSQLTEDHNLGMLVSQARESQTQAPVMSRFLDGRPDRSPDLMLREAEPGDRYLLCTDGLSGVVPARHLRDALAAAGTPAEAARDLLRLADSAGAPDNITAIVVHAAGGNRDATAPIGVPVVLGAVAAAGVTR